MKKVTITTDMLKKAYDVVKSGYIHTLYSETVGDKFAYGIGLDKDNNSLMCFNLRRKDLNKKTVVDEQFFPSTINIDSLQDPDFFTNHKDELYDVANRINIYIDDVGYKTYYPFDSVVFSEV